MKHKKMDHEGHGMRSARMPSEHFEHGAGELGHPCKRKYAGEFSNPKDLDKANEALASYVNSHKMEY